MAKTAIPTKRRGRKARKRERIHAPIIHRPTLVMNIPVYDILDEERVELVHETAMSILEETGCEFREAESIALWRDVGADITEQRVRISRELLM